MDKTNNISYTIKEIQHDPLNFLKKLSYKFQRDIISYTVEGEKIVLVNHPEHIKTVLQTQDKIFVKDGTPEMLMLHPILGNGLLTSTSKAWKEQRKVAHTAFKMEKIFSFVDIMIEETLDLIKEWKTEEELDIETEMSELTLRIVSKALFGNSLKHVSEQFSEAVRIINLQMGHFDANDYEGRIAFGKALSWLRLIVSQVIDERKHSEVKHNDFLSDLLDNQGKEGFSDTDLIDQVFTFLMAGHETTAKSLTWTLYELSQNNQVLQTLEDELETVLKGGIPTIATIPYLTKTWKILQESMRLNPPVWIISRRATQTYVLADEIIPEGTLVLVSPYMIHRHPKYWECPEKFDFERFSDENIKIRPIYAHIPFSGGPRHCVGKNFASMEVIIVLSLLVDKFKFELKKDFEVIPEALVTLRPKNGMKMIVKYKK